MSPAPSAIEAAWLVARFGVLELLWSPRSLAMVLIAASPLALALLYRVAAALEMAAASTGYGAFSAIVSGASFPFVAPMLALFYASGVVSDDVEAGTMPYFLTRPVPRPAFLAGKMLASLVMSAALFLPSLVVAFYAILAPEGFSEIGARFPVLARHLGVGLLGLAAYNGIFALAGVVLRRPLLAGLFFIFGWQAAATFVPGKARLFTVAHYLRSLVPEAPLESGLGNLLGQRSSLPASIAALLLIAAASHVLAAALFARKEIR